MAEAVILHAFSQHAPAIRQRQTWAMLELVRRHGRHVIIDWPCSGDQDYHAGIVGAWPMGETLILLEHDVEAGLEQLLQLEDCPHPVCVQAYQLHPGSTGLPVDVWAWRNRGEWGREQDDFAELFSFGCIAFKKAAFEMSDPARWSHDGWQNIDHGASLDFRARGVRAHIHWPAVAHHHH